MTDVVDVRARVVRLRRRGLNRDFANVLWWTAEEERVRELEALTDAELAKIGPPA